MKVACIGDVHGTPKFLECYANIKEKDNDVKKIIVLGDHFDPYDIIIDFNTMVDRYRQFIECCHNDDRIISILGNHDLSGYIINDGGTNRTYSRYSKEFGVISSEICKNLPDSYLTYKIGNYIFSHAGVSKKWLEMLDSFNPEYSKMILTNKRGWNIKELTDMCSFYTFDYSYYGADIRQGCTWIRPNSLCECAIEGYNQVVGHTQTTGDISSIKMENGMKLWLTDNQRKSEYLILNIEEVG